MISISLPTPPSDYYQQSSALNLNDLSTLELRNMHDALKAQEMAIQGATNTGQDIEIAIKLDKINIQIKQVFIHGELQTFIQFPGGRRKVAQTSLRALITDLDSLLKKRNHADDKFHTNPSIKRLTWLQAREAVQAFNKNLLGWNSVAVPEGQDKSAHIDITDPHSPQRTVQERWNKKLQNVHHVSHCLNTVTVTEMFYVYEISGAPAGIMVLEDDPESTNLLSLSVELIVTHPGASGAGGSLIEFAVAESVKLGMNGRLNVGVISDADTRQAYLAMGFEFVNSKFVSANRMRLDPANCPEKWYQNSAGEWKFISHKNQRYLHTAFNSDL